MTNSPEIRRRIATAGDEQFMRDLHKAASRDLVIRQFGQWDDELQASLFSKKWVPERFEILENAGEAIGCIRISDRPDCRFLEEIQILPKFQCRGIGTSLIREEIESSRRQQKPVRLQVLKKNVRALALYKRLGIHMRGSTDRHFVLTT